MRLWFDEDLSPSLVQVANALGFEATCNRDRAMLASKDPELRRVVQAEGYVFVTNNAADFRPMYSREDIHPGLIVMPGDHGLELQRRHAGEVLQFIAAVAEQAAESPADCMINKVAEIYDDGKCEIRDLRLG